MTQSWNIANIEAIDPVVQYGPDVNKILPSSWNWFRNADGAIVFTVTGPAGCGALITWKFPPPVIGAVTLTKVRLFWEEMATGNEFRDEHDIKIVLPPKATDPAAATCANLSTQINLPSGMVQSDDANRKWKDRGITIPGGKLPLNQWASYAIEGSFDPAAKTFVFEAFWFNGVRVPVPAPETLPFQVPGPNPWDPVTTVQMQIEIAQAGSGTICYRNIQLECAA